MRHNRVLGLAIASALTIGANSSFGGELSIEHVVYQDTNGTSCQAKTAGHVILASEIFLSGDPTIFSPFTCGTNGADNLDNGGVDGPALDGTYDDGYFYGTYKFTQDTLDTEPFYVQFTLDNGAQFGKDINLSSGTSLDMVAHPSGSHSGVLKTSGGMAGDTEVTFYITPNDGFNNKELDTLFMRFNMKNLGVLKSAGQEINLGARVYDINDREFDGTTSSALVATSTQATKVSIDAYSGSAQIDVAQDSLLLVGSGTAYLNSTTVKLGSASISNNTSGGTVIDDTARPWTFESSATGSLTVVNLPSSASLADPGFIFLDFDNDGVYDDGTDMLATIDPSKPTTAVWNLTADQLTDFYSAGGTTKVDIVLQVDGTNPIEEQSDAPKATFTITYPGGDPQSFNRDFIHIKRNGTVCTIYNVPSNTAIDKANIRITNTSASEITISASLRDSTGMYVFQEQELPNTPLASNATLYISGDDLWCNMTYTSDWETANGTDCSTFRNQRGTLTINSDAKSMEIYGLVRNRAGGLFTNMSVGATGNGCD
jgi:hypothetical protein